jgi:hypothetical protein
MATDYAAEIPFRKALLDASIKAKKCLNVQQLWDASTELLAAKDAMFEAQRAEQMKEIEDADRIVR